MTTAGHQHGQSQADSGNSTVHPDHGSQLSKLVFGNVAGMGTSAPIPAGTLSACEMTAFDERIRSGQRNDGRRPPSRPRR